jgi:integrase
MTCWPCSKPIWEAKCETAARLRGRIERILARATVEGLRRGANPATWRGHLQEALPARSEVQPVQHFRAMEFRDLPAFMVELCQIDTVGAAALRFLILTAARAGEVLGAQWPEINWTETRGRCPPFGPRPTATTSFRYPQERLPRSAKSSRYAA